jgi:hypothetical protein
VKFETINTSIVIAAMTHNPSILHPSFLELQRIVPSDWKLAEPPFCTPPVSVVKYLNHVAFKCELDKFMVLLGANIEQPSISELAAKYVQVLPHVNYSAVGTNFAGYAECSNPESVIVSRFLKKGAGNDEKLAPKTATIKLIYALEKGIVSLSFEVGSFKRSDEQTDRPCLLVNGNIHTEISASSRLQETITAINQHSSNVAKIKEMANTVFESEAVC